MTWMYELITDERLLVFLVFLVPFYLAIRRGPEK